MSEQNTLLPEKSWFYRNWKWFLPISCIVLIIITFILILGDIITRMGTAIADPKLIGLAERKARSHPDIQIYFGDEMQTGTILEGDVLLSEDGKTIKATVPIKGKKGSGMMDIFAHRVDQKWVHDSIHVRLKKPKKKTIKLST